MTNVPRRLERALAEGKIVPFVGAGVSMAVTCGGQRIFPSWKELLEKAAHWVEAERRLGHNTIRDHVALGEYVEAARFAKKFLGPHWTDFLQEAFDADRKTIDDDSLELARAVWRLGSKLIVTTNYERVLKWACPEDERDGLHEWQIEEPHGQVQASRGASDRSTIWHLHGSIADPTKIILAPDGYAQLYANDEQERAYQAALTTLQSFVVSRHLLFIGFSLDDEAIVRQLEWVRDTFKGCAGPHYALVRESEVQAMRAKLEGIHVQPLSFEGFGQPMLDRLAELAGYAKGRRKPVPRVMSTAKPCEEVIDFAGERARHQHFFGREEILAELDRWLSVHASGWLVLTGSPGLGKSAILNRWLELREQLGSATAAHFIRRGVHNWGVPAVIRANLAAQIECDFPEQRDIQAEPGYRLEQLLERVSPVLVKRGQHLVLLVDGLDEAMELDDKHNPLPQILPHTLPANVFVYVGSRPNYPKLGWIEARHEPHRRVDLDKHTEDNLLAVRAYWGALRGRLTPPIDDELVAAAVERSEGNLYHAVRLWQRWRDPKEERSLETIPRGFKGMLEGLWTRLGELPREKKRLAREGLSLLSAAREALPLSVVEDLLDWEEGEAEDELLPLVNEMLLEERWHAEAAYRPFHEGVREFVAGKQPRNIRERHGQLAAYASWPAEAGFRRQYALRHRVAHLIEAGEVEAAGECCWDVSYLGAKTCELGVLEVEREVRLAARAQNDERRGSLERLAQVLGACSHWAREVPEALPALLYDRLLTNAPEVLKRMRWPSHLPNALPRLRHPLQVRSTARVVRAQGRVTAVAVLSDARVVCGFSDNTFRMLDVDSGQTLATLSGHRREVSAVAVLPDGRVVSGSYDKTLRVWDVDSAQTLAIFSGHESWISAVAVLPDGRVVSGSHDKTLRVWDIDSGQTLATLSGHRQGVSAVAVLSGGRVVSGSHDKTLRVWDADSGQTLATLSGHQQVVGAVAVLPDGRVISGSRDGTLRIWDVDSGQMLATLSSHRREVHAVAVLPDGRVVSGSSDHTLRVWDVDSGQTLATLSGHTSWVSAIAVLADGRIVSGSDDWSLRVWDVHSGQTLTPLAGHKSLVSAVAMLPDGRVVSGSYDHTLRVWDVNSGQTLATLSGHTSWVSAVAVLPEGRVVSASDDNTLRVWDVDSGQTLATLSGHRKAVTAVAVLLDGRVVSGSSDATLRIWDVDSGQSLATLYGHESWVSAVAVLPEGRVVSGSDDHTLRVWDVNSGQLLATLWGHQQEVRAVVVLPDGRVVSGSDDHTLRVWDVHSGRTLAVLSGHKSLVDAVVPLPDGRVVSASGDHTLRVWDVDSGRTLAALYGHQDMVTAVAVLPDGRVVSGSHDHTLRVWDVDTGQSLATVYTDVTILSVTVVSQHFVVAGDAIGNVQFITLPGRW